MKKPLSLLLIILLLCSLTAASASETAAFSGANDTFSIERALFIYENLLGFTESDMRQIADRFGLTLAIAYGYDKPDDERSPSCAFSLFTGVVNVDGLERNAAIISVRGTGAGEWYTNFDFAIGSEGGSEGGCEFAENFMFAARLVLGMVTPVIKEIDDPFIVVTGYSRGAACANLVGMLLDDRYGPENVSVYTFATPNTVRGEHEGYDNIFNICNDKDAVTHWPLKAWGFSRIGWDILMSDPAVDFSAVQEIFDIILELAPDADAYYNLRHSMPIPGISDEGMSVYDLSVLLSDSMYTGSREEAFAALDALTAEDSDLKELISKFIEMNAGTGGRAGMLTEHGYETYRTLIRQLD